VDARERAERELSNERRRVAAELHDTLEQTLTAASLQLNAATRTQGVKPPEAVNPLLLATQLIARSRQEVREAVWDLRLDQRAAIPLGPVIRQVCEESSAGSVQIEFVEEGEARPCPAHLAVQVIRLVREAIANALKHGAPQQVTVRFVHGPESLELTIEDDGRGFDTTAAPGPDSGHFGLSGMEERTQRSGGHFQLTSAPGQGCRIRIVIPFTETGK
jgi:signal transduction histidine kinase